MPTMKKNPVTGTKTHPYIAQIMIDPARCHRFEQAFEDRPEVKIRRVDHDQPDTWTVWVACASDEVRRLLESGW